LIKFRVSSKLVNDVKLVLDMMVIRYWFELQLSFNWSINRIRALFKPSILEEALKSKLTI